MVDINLGDTLKPFVVSVYYLGYDKSGQKQDADNNAITQIEILIDVDKCNME